MQRARWRGWRGILANGCKGGLGPTGRWRWSRCPVRRFLSKPSGLATGRFAWSKRRRYSATHVRRIFLGGRAPNRAGLHCAPQCHWVAVLALRQPRCWLWRRRRVFRVLIWLGPALRSKAPATRSCWRSPMPSFGRRARRVPWPTCRLCPGSLFWGAFGGRQRPRRPRTPGLPMSRIWPRPCCRPKRQTALPGSPQPRPNGAPPCAVRLAIRPRIWHGHLARLAGSGRIPARPGG